jgi:hypothetical protein
VDVSSSSDSSSSSDDDSSSEDSSSSEDEENTNAGRLQQKKEDAKRKADAASKAALEWQPSKVIQAAEIKTTAGTDGAQALLKGKPFQRVDSDFWGGVAVQTGGAMADNSYEGTFNDQGFGAKSSEKLLQVRGKDFRHEKTKRKRSFNGLAKTGGRIDTDQTFSTKYTYSDDDK